MLIRLTLGWLLRQGPPFLTVDLILGLAWGACSVWNWDDATSIYTIGFSLLAPVLLIAAACLYLRTPRAYLVAASVHLLAVLQSAVFCVHYLTLSGKEKYANETGAEWSLGFLLFFAYATVHAFLLDRDRAEANRDSAITGSIPVPRTTAADELDAKPGWDQARRQSRKKS